jgi:ABC-type Zn2+ transport system substrate-binding protein/surface adhesin
MHRSVQLGRGRREKEEAREETQKGQKEKAQKEKEVNWRGDRSNVQDDHRHEGTACAAYLHGHLSPFTSAPPTSAL